jgi:hypothetical protein
MTAWRFPLTVAGSPSAPAMGGLRFGTPLRTGGGNARGAQEAVLQLAFTPDGDHLVSVSKDQLRFWRAPSWAEIEAAEKESRK